MASIVDSKYRDKYKGNKDWLATLMDEEVTRAITKTKTTTDKETGAVTTEEVVLKGRTLDFELLFALAVANGFKVDEYRRQVESHGAAGRLRMTIGNMLRAAARKRHGLYVIRDGAPVWVEASAEFIGDGEKTQNPDGSAIQKPKAVPVADAQPTTEEPKDEDEQEPATADA